MSVSDPATPLLEGFGAFSPVQKVSLLYLYHLYFLFLFNTHFTIINSQDCLYFFFNQNLIPCLKLILAVMCPLPFGPWAGPLSLASPKWWCIILATCYHPAPFCPHLIDGGELNGMTFTNLGDILTGSPHGLKGLTDVVADICLAFLPFPEVLGSILQTALYRRGAAMGLQYKPCLEWGFHKDSDTSKEGVGRSQRCQR